MSLDHSPFVSALPERERDRLLDRAVPRTLDRGDALYLTGDDERRVYVVDNGILKLACCDTEGRETTLALALPGDLVGETAACDGELQPLDVIALTPTTVIGIAGEVFIDVAVKNGAAAAELARTMAARTRWIAATASERTTNDVPSRLAGRLLALAEIIGRMRSGTIEVDLPLTRTDVGQLAGMCRESASKTLNSWKRQGVLEHNGQTLRIFRPDALERIRCAGRAGEPSPSRDAADLRLSR